MSGLRGRRTAARWSLYMVRCRDGSLYTGIASDVSRRFTEHQQSSRRSAKYLRCRRPLRLVLNRRVGGRLTLSSPTVGASIGYRIAGETPNHWHLYSGTFHAQQSQSIEARAIRYGYRESEISRKELCQLAVSYSGSH